MLVLYLDMGGSRYLRSKRLQMQPESLSSMSTVDGEHDTHPNKSQDQDQESDVFASVRVLTWQNGKI